MAIQNNWSHNDYVPQYSKKQNYPITYCVSKFLNNRKAFNEEFITFADNLACYDSIGTKLTELRKNTKAYLQYVQDTYKIATSFNVAEWLGNKAYTYVTFINENLYPYFANVFNEIIKSNIDYSLLEEHYAYYINIINAWNNVVEGDYSEWKYDPDYEDVKVIGDNGRYVRVNGVIQTRREQIDKYSEVNGGKYIKKCERCKAEPAGGTPTFTKETIDSINDFRKAAVLIPPTNGSKFFSAGQGTRIHANRSKLTNLYNQLTECLAELEAKKDDIRNTEIGSIKLPDKPEKYVEFKENLTAAQESITGEAEKICEFFETLRDDLKSYTTEVNSSK